MITDLNHITLSVSDLDRSFGFYVERLGLRPHAKWARGAYLSAGSLWLCLSLDARCRDGALPEYTHIAFSVPDAQFAAFAQQLVEQGVPVWKDNSSEGDSLYILDPDGHKLEIHVGSLQSRLESLKERPYEGLVLF
jgi:catechol 2,3-dioxygenase-like lactoylglutathione lyase family enzyme